MNENRIEKKFVLGKFKDDFIKKFLSINGFTKQYPDRVINSIYLDTKNYDFARDKSMELVIEKKLDLDGIITMRQQFFMRKKIKKIFRFGKISKKLNY